MKKIALITPYLDIFGGAEKYLLDIGQVLDQNGYNVELFWPDSSVKAQLIKRFGHKFDFIEINDSWHKLTSWQKLVKTKDYDIIFYHSDGSYFASLAKKNYSLYQVPKLSLINPTSFWQKIKFSLWVPIFNSRFSKQFYLKHIRTKKYYILHPTIEKVKKNLTQKEPIILSVGRMFAHLHSKRQDILIKAFIKGQTKYPSFKKYRLILIGAFKKEDQEYLNYLQKLSKNHANIFIKTNLSHSEVQDYYNRASIYWHGAGYQINETKNPELVEHFGTTIVEAMNYYCVPIAYEAGGPKETILQNKTGFLYKTQEDLLKYTNQLITNPPRRTKMALLAHSQAIDKFGKTAFTKQLNKIIK